MKSLCLFLFLVLTLPYSVHADETIHLDIGKSYEGYTNDELRRRVWQLERAVAQLQDQVFQLALQNRSGAAPVTQLWTCQIESFGKTHVASGTTRASALAQVLKKCGDATNAVHCQESNVKCGNE